MSLTAIILAVTFFAPSLAVSREFSECEAAVCNLQAMNALQVCRRVLTEAEDRDDVDGSVRTRLLIAGLYFGDLNTGRALGEFEGALERARHSESPEALVWALNALGAYHWQRDGADRARVLWDEALLLTESMSGSSERAFALLHAAQSACRDNDQTECERSLRDVIGASGENSVGDEHPVLLVQIGNLLQDAGRVHEARDLYLRAVRASASPFCAVDFGLALNSLGVAALDLHNLKDATIVFEFASLIAVYLARIAVRGTVTNNLAATNRLRGEPQRAAALYSVAITIRRKFADPSLAGTLLNLANLQINEGEYVEARANAYEALGLAVTLRDLALQGWAFQVLGWIERRLGRHDEALPLYQAAVTRLEAAGDDRMLANALSGIGSLSPCDEFSLTSDAYHQRAINLARGIDSPELLSRTILNRACALAYRCEYREELEALLVEAETACVSVSSACIERAAEIRRTAEETCGHE